MTKTTFSNVSILTIGPARGHRMQIDRATLDGVLSLVQGRNLKAYVSHANATGDRLGAEVGTFSNFRIDGDRIRADFAFLESFATHNPRVHQTLVELAERDAESFGVSITGILAKSWALQDGTELPAMDEWESQRPGNALFEYPSARFSDVRSADFVSQPAANVGLFAAMESKLAARDAELATLTKERDGLLVELARLRNAADEINTLRAKITALATRLEQAEVYDMRKAGAVAMTMSPGALSDLPPAPAADANDQTKWAHYVALEKVSKRAAETYRQQHLTLSARG